MKEEKVNAHLCFLTAIATCNWVRDLIFISSKINVKKNTAFAVSRGLNCDKGSFRKPVWTAKKKTKNFFNSPCADSSLLNVYATVETHECAHSKSSKPQRSKHHTGQHYLTTAVPGGSSFSFCAITAAGKWRRWTRAGEYLQGNVRLSAFAIGGNRKRAEVKETWQRWRKRSVTGMGINCVFR